MTDVATVTGQGRLPTDLAGELMDVLADEPSIVLCDLQGMAAGASVSEVFAPVGPYLAHWPGTVVVVHVDDPRMRDGLFAAEGSDRLLVDESVESGLDHALERVPPVQHAAVQLSPLLTASRDARRFVTRTLLDWQLPRLVAPASLVVSELVTNSIVHAVTVIELTLSVADDKLRIAVHDHGGGSPRAPGGEAAEHLLGGRGLMVVQAFTCCWGVFPSRGRGKTVWAVTDQGRPAQGQRSRATSS
ncbi:MAG TPA: ATP-binding protein [Nocardioidaceae bacterium]|nr:ATP-binding protein [Nocardioidaceae bacterium]